MKEYICTVCGYVHKIDGELPDDFICPICGAGREAFRLKGKNETPAEIEKPHTEKKLSAMEMSIICSNLARGCEKQYLFEESKNFNKLAAFFRSDAQAENTASTQKILELIDGDLSSGFPYGNAVAGNNADRGALRALTWSEKVTRMLQSLLSRYAVEGDKMLENTGVYVCTVCGFVYVGNEPPKICPVCKVPDWKFEKIERRAI